MIKPGTRGYSHFDAGRRTHESMDVPISLFVEAICLFDFIQRVLLERSLHPVQDVEDVVLLRPPGPEARGEVKRAVLLGDERVEDVGEELHSRGPLGVV